MAGEGDLTQVWEQEGRFDWRRLSGEPRVDSPRGVTQQFAPADLLRQPVRAIRLGQPPEPDGVEVFGYILPAPGGSKMEMPD